MNHIRCSNWCWRNIKRCFYHGSQTNRSNELNSFGSPDNKKTQNLLSGVVSGIGGYGNSVGIPTVGGETKFNSTYNENILVNAMAIGHANKQNILF